MVKYSDIDNTLAGGLLPGGAKPAGAIDPQAKADREAQQSCIAQGGKWDPKTKTCIMPQPKAPEPKPTTTQNQDQVFRDSETGNISGVTISGKTYLGLSPQDVEKMTAAQQAKTQGGPATQAFEGNAIAQQQATTQLQQQADLLTQPQTILTPDGREVVQPESAISKGATIAAGTAGAVAGAKTLAAIGTAIAPGIGTVIGGIVGAVSGFIGGAYVKQRVQKTSDVKEAFKVYSQAVKNKGEIINFVNAGIVTEGQARALWAEEKQNIYASYAYLKRETQNDLNNFLGSPGDELIQVEAHIALDPQYDLEFEKALLAPNPAMIRNFAEVSE